MRTATKSADEIIREIAETLSQTHGEFIEDIANQVLTTPVKYIEDSLFEVGVIGKKFKIGDPVYVTSKEGNPPNEFAGIVIGFKDILIQVRDQEDDVFDCDEDQCEFIIP